MSCTYVTSVKFVFSYLISKQLLGREKNLVSRSSLWKIKEIYIHVNSKAVVKFVNVNQNEQCNCKAFKVNTPLKTTIAKQITALLCKVFPTTRNNTYSALQGKHKKKK